MIDPRINRDFHRSFANAMGRSTTDRVLPGVVTAVTSGASADGGPTVTVEVAGVTTVAMFIDDAPSQGATVLVAFGANVPYILGTLHGAPTL